MTSKQWIIIDTDDNMVMDVCETKEEAEENISINSQFGLMDTLAAREATISWTEKE